MSTATNALINYDAEFAKIAEETRNSLAPTKGNHISTKGKIFTFPGGATQPNFDCIVLDFIRINQLMTPYNPNVRGVTKCWAMGRNEHLLAPSETATHKQADNCGACAMNKYGSATNGGKGKACQNLYRLAIVPPDAGPENDIWLVKVSPTGLSNWSHYVKMANTQIGEAGFCRIITNLSFDPNKDYPSLIFKMAGPISHPEVVLNLRMRAREAVMTEPSAD